MGLNLIRHSFAAMVALAIVVSSASGVQPAADLLPDNTCLFVAFPNVQTFKDNFRETQLGKLIEDPVMKPFAEDLAAQIRDRFGATENQLGLKWEEMRGAFSGEVCLARTLPAEDEHAIILLADATDRADAVDKLRATLITNLTKREAKVSKVKLAGVEVDRFELKKQVWEVKPSEVFFAFVKQQLLITNHSGLAEDVISQALSATPGSERLKDARTFSEVMGSVAAESKGLAPDVQWFIDPFKYAETLRNARSQRRRTRRKDYLAILKSQGFDAVRAAGGHINLSTNDFEVIHRTFVFAPPVTDQPSKYQGAARMLAFAESNHVPLPKWVPRDVATMLSMNWNVLNGFNYATGLIDQIVDSEGFVEDVLKSFETDKNGPMINIRTELLAFLDDHILTFSDNVLPISTKSERILVAVRVKDEAAAVKALEKLWKGEPDARGVKIGKHEVWEIIPEDVDLSDIELPGSVPLPGAVPLPGEESGGGEDEGDIKLPNSAMTVSRGPDPNDPPYLMIATSIDLLRDVLAENRPPFEMLSSSADFKFIDKQLTGLGAGKDSFRFFSRTDEEFRASYELIRQGKMPESESMLGRVLNRIFGPQEENVVRKPEIDGAKMPDYQIVRRYLGPAGLFVKSKEDGWFVTGIMVSKQKMAAGDGAQAKLISQPQSQSVN